MCDSAAAEALRLAERILIKRGWRFTGEDIGKLAKAILDELKEAKP